MRFRSILHPAHIRRVLVDQLEFWETDFPIYRPDFLFLLKDLYSIGRSCSPTFTWCKPYQKKGPPFSRFLVKKEPDSLQPPPVLVKLYRNNRGYEIIELNTTRNAGT